VRPDRDVAVTADDSVDLAAQFLDVVYLYYSLAVIERLLGEMGSVWCEPSATT
jgi:hypothetical protein